MTEKSLLESGHKNWTQHNTRWDIRWLEKALFEATWSKDPDHKVGAVAVLNPGTDNVQLMSGFNGFPRHINDDPVLYENDLVKKSLMVHAEQNLICNAARSGVCLRGSTVYVTHPVCHVCAGLLAQAGVARVVFIDRPMSNNFKNNYKPDLAQDILEVCQVGFTTYALNLFK